MRLKRIGKSAALLCRPLNRGVRQGAHGVLHIEGEVAWPAWPDLGYGQRVLTAVTGITVATRSAVSIMPKSMMATGKRAVSAGKDSRLRCTSGTAPMSITSLSCKTRRLTIQLSAKV